MAHVLAAVAALALALLGHAQGARFAGDGRQHSMRVGDEDFAPPAPAPVPIWHQRFTIDFNVRWLGWLGYEAWG